MGGLAHYFEEEGLATTQISLIRLHSEIIKPPRALWVPFELGRPLGAPGDAAFQRRVLLAALRLLEAPAGPVLEDYGEEAPEAPEADAGWACPVDLPRPGGELDRAQQLAAALRAEIEQLATWYDLAQKEHHRTTMGASGLGAREIGEFLAGFLDGGVPHNPRPEIELPWLIKLASEDLKAYYLEAATAKPGSAPLGSAPLADWFWGQTVAGRVHLELQKLFLQRPETEFQLLAKLLLVPVSQAHRSLLRTAK